MTLNLSPELEAALTRQAQAAGTNAEALAMRILTERVLLPVANSKPKLSHEAFLAALDAIAVDCGVVLSDEALRRENMYD